MKIVLLLLTVCAIASESVSEDWNGRFARIFKGYEGSIQCERVMKRLELAEGTRKFVENERAKGEDGRFYAESAEADLRKFDEMFADEAKRWPLTPKAAGGPAEARRFDVREFGAVGDGATDDAPAFGRAIEAARALGGVPCEVRIPAGVYTMRTPIAGGQPRIIGITNCVFVGEGPDKTRIRYGVWNARGCTLDRCDNVTLKGLEFAWERIPQLQGRVLATDLTNSAVTIRRKAGTLHPLDPSWAETADGKLGKDLSGIRKFCCSQHDAKTGQVDKRASWMFYLGVADDLGDDVWRLHIDPKGFNTLPSIRPGCDLVVVDRNEKCDAIVIMHSEYCTLDGCVVRNSRAAAMIVAGHMSTVANCRVEPLEGMWMSSNADGCYCRLGTYLAHCMFRGMSDDGVNAHYIGGELYEVVLPRKVVCSLDGPERAGEYFTLCDPITGEWRGGFVAKSARKVEWRGRVALELEADRDLDERVVGWNDIEGGVPDKLKRIHIGQSTANLAKMATQIHAAAANGVGSVVTDCTFKWNRGCGIVIQGSNALVEDSTVDGVMDGFRIGTLLRYREGPAPYNVKARNVRLLDNRWALNGLVNVIGNKPAQVAPMRGMKWENLVISNATDAAVSLSNFDDSEIRGVTIFGPKNSIHTRNCGTFRVDGVERKP